MNVETKKACWNCEREVLVNQENCFSCGVYLSPLSSFESNPIFIPPYRTHVEEESEAAPQKDRVERDVEEETTLPALILSLTLLLMGSLFFLFSLLMLFFSENGRLTLAWDASYWYLYALAAPLLLFFGWKKL